MSIRKNIKQKLKKRYEVVLRDSLFEEKKKVSLTIGYFLLSLFATVITICFLTFVVIAFTPLKNFIPNYTPQELKTQGINNMIKSDSLEKVIRYHEKYINNLLSVISGEKIINKQRKVNRNKNRILKPSKNKNSLSGMVENEQELISLIDFEGNSELVHMNEDYYLFKPTNGLISNKFNPAQKHFGVDIVSEKNEAVRAILKGVVVFSECTIETGHVIQIQHPNNLLSIYKHNESLLKTIGMKVETGEIIALVGNSGEYTSGPHLHFELWKSGIPINPEPLFNF